MVQAAVTLTPIRGHTAPQNPLDTAIHNAGRALCALQMTRLVCVGRPNKREAELLVNDLLDIARIVDTALLAIGTEARDHFGNDVDLEPFADQLLGALDGNATYSISQAAEKVDSESNAEYRAGAWGDYLQAAE
jgi:hypothetical protein